jgi:hypothetical protein
MPKKDPAFLFYPGDWLKGTQLMSRPHKGAYMDLLMAQFSNGHMALDDIRTVLGVDYENMWESKLKSKFVQDDNSLYYNEKLESVMNERSDYKTGRLNNLKGKKEPHIEPHMSPPYEDTICLNEDIDYLYSLYPTRDKNNDNRTTGKTAKNKIKIQQLLKTIAKETLEKKINWYLKDCEDTKKYLMNFGTFLNNLPEEVETPAPVKDKYNGRIPGLTYWIPS